MSLIILIRFTDGISSKTDIFTEQQQGTGRFCFITHLKKAFLGPIQAETEVQKMPQIPVKQRKNPFGLLPALRNSALLRACFHQALGSWSSRASDWTVIERFANLPLPSRCICLYCRDMQLQLGHEAPRAMSQVHPSQTAHSSAWVRHASSYSQHHAAKQCHNTPSHL